MYYDYTVEIEEIVKFDIGKDARDIEERLLSMSELRYYDEKFDGYTELFKVNPIIYLSSIE